MQIAQMRALENGRWLLRATNNGVTGIVNPRGEITAELPQFEANVLRGELEVMKGRTPYSKIGDIPALFLLTVLLVVTIRRRRWTNFSSRDQVLSGAEMLSLLACVPDQFAQ